MKTNLLKTTLLLVALLVISGGLMAQRTIWQPGGDQNGSGVWEDPANWTDGLPGTTVEGRAIFKGGECFVSTDVSGTFRVELGDNKDANHAKLTIEDGGIVGANRTVNGGHSEVGIWSPATLIVEEGASMSTGTHLWIGTTKSYDGGADANMGSEVHINGGTITVGEMFGIDFYNNKEFSGGTLFMNGGLLDLAQWKAADPDDNTVSASLGKHGKIEYTAGLIKIVGDHKASLEYFRDNDQITGEFEIWVEQNIGEVADSLGNMVPDTTYITKLSNEGSGELATDATLSELTLSAGTLDPAFDAATSDYTVELPAGTTATPTVTATTTDANATVVVTDAADVTSAEDADRTTTIVITAEDGETVLTYTVLFNVEGTSVTDLDIENLIYPNPASSKLFISHTVKIDRVEIFNITGSRVINLNNVTTEAIDVSDLTSGLYFISVIDVNNNNIVRKFIKQ